MVGKWEMDTLVKVAAIGGLVTSATGYTLFFNLQRRVRDSPAYQEAMTMINNNPKLVDLMGKPIKSKRIDLGNKKNILSLKYTSLEVPVVGPKAEGILYLMADRLTAQDNWNIYKMELELLDEFGGKVSLINKKPLISIELPS